MSTVLSFKNMGSAPAETDVDLESWRNLYELAGRVRELAPWTWMEEIDIFGVEYYRMAEAFRQACMK